MIDLNSMEAWLRGELAAMDIKGASLTIARVGQQTDKPAIQVTLEWQSAVARLVIWDTGEWDVDRVGDDESYKLYRYSEDPSREAIHRAIEELIEPIAQATKAAPEAM